MELTSVPGFVLPDSLFMWYDTLSEGFFFIEKNGEYKSVVFLMISDSYSESRQI